MDQIELLADLEDSKDFVDGMDPQAIDVDRWELVISPEKYLNCFKDSLADIHLICRAPIRDASHDLSSRTSL
jgi:hypothetical protein